MRITWRGLELPTRIERDTEIADGNYGCFNVEPFERGFGITIGNSLRRILLSSLEGSAITSIKLAGVDHEFASIKGVVEDVSEIVLNVKKLVLRSYSDESKTVKISVKKIGDVTAADIVADADIEVVNKDLVIATLTEDVSFEMEMVVENGRGYSPAAERISEIDRYDSEAGRIIIDAIYSPITRVRYKTENTRVGQKTNYDKLVLEIWTDGTVSPDMALVEAAKILRKYVNPFVNYTSAGQETVEQEIVVEEEVSAVDEELMAKLNMPIQELEFSVRTTNCTEAINIVTVRDLVIMTEAELLKVRSFGKTCLREVRRKLADMDLSLGMTGIEG